MADGLEDLWSKFSLTEEEEIEIVIDKQWVEETLEEGSAYLIAKVLSRKVINREVMRNVLQKVWKLSGGLQVREVGEKLYVFQFDLPIEKDRVLLQQPWCFNKALLVMKDFDAFTIVEDIVLDHCVFWVQVHGLPLGLMNEKIGFAVGQSLGNVVEVETCGEKVAWGKSKRIRVSLEVDVPLKRGIRISVPGVGKLQVSFRYERLPDFCYVCGRLTHNESECDEAIRIQKQGGKLFREYGAWWRSEMPRVSSGALDGPFSNMANRGSSSFSGSERGAHKRTVVEADEVMSVSRVEDVRRREQVSTLNGKENVPPTISWDPDSKQLALLQSVNEDKFVGNSNSSQLDGKAANLGDTAHLKGKEIEAVPHSVSNTPYDMVGQNQVTCGAIDERMAVGLESNIFVFGVSPKSPVNPTRGPYKWKKEARMNKKSNSTGIEPRVRTSGAKRTNRDATSMEAFSAGVAKKCREAVMVVASEGTGQVQNGAAEVGMASQPCRDQ